VYLKNIIAKDYQLILTLKEAGPKTNTHMYLGELHDIDGNIMVYLPSAPVKQKWYPLSQFNNVIVVDKLESRIVEVELIPNEGELDEQPEYTARIVSQVNLN
jgi:hypothetical protein